MCQLTCVKYCITFLSQCADLSLDSRHPFIMHKQLVSEPPGEILLLYTHQEWTKLLLYFTACCHVAGFNVYQKNRTGFTRILEWIVMAFYSVRWRQRPLHAFGLRNRGRRGVTFPHCASVGQWPCLWAWLLLNTGGETTSFYTFATRHPGVFTS